jgi:hypothetical protein
MSKKYYAQNIFLFITIFTFILIISNNNCFANNGSINNDIIPFSVMIGNSPAEQDVQKGLSKAKIIYEIEVEFPFTRLMAVFFSDVDTIVGPVRSSRYYFSRICAEWSAIFAHCGGQNLKNPNIIDINELNNPSSYWRDKNIGGWINLFTNLSKLKNKAKQIDSNRNKPAQHPLLNFGNLKSDKLNQVFVISIKYHKDYIVRYQYSPEDKLYYRFINDKPHIDKETKEQIKIANILIQTTAINEIIGDEEGRMRVELIGEGLGRLFREGHSQPVKWVKQTKDDQTSFLDSKGDIINYKPGNTWIHILAYDREIWCK